MPIETVKGFQDFTGEEAVKREKIREIIVQNFRLYGFEPAEPPVIEYEEFVKGDNQQDEAVSDIFKLQDKGERKLALRYEFTFQLKRISQNKKLPYKRYQIGPVFRDEPVTGNRFRQFTQLDIDMVGSSTKEEAEILSLTLKVLNECGIKAVINVNNRKLLNEILEEQGIIADKEKVIREIDKLDKLPESEVRENLKKFNAENVLDIFKKEESYFKKYEAYSEIEELKKYSKFYGIEINFTPTLARGLSYYNGSVFEVKTKEMKETIAGGGSFLVNGIQATGISFGLERLSILADVDINRTKTLIISLNQDKESISLAQNLRKNEISCSVLFGKPSKALEYANAYQIPFVIMLGEDEVKKKKAKLKNMKTGKEEMLSEKDVIKKLIK